MVSFSPRTLTLYLSKAKKKMEPCFFSLMILLMDYVIFLSQGIIFQVSGSNWRDTTILNPASSSYIGFPMSLSSSPTSSYFTTPNVGASMISSNMKQEQQLHIIHPPLQPEPSLYHNGQQQQQQQQPSLLTFRDSVIKDQDYHSNSSLHGLYQTVDHQQASDSDDTDSYLHRHHCHHPNNAVTAPASSSGTTFSLFANTPPFCSRDLLSTSSGSPEQRSSSDESTINQQLQQYNHNSNIHPVKSRSYTPMNTSSSTSRRSESSSRYELTSSYSYQDNTFDIDRVRNSKCKKKSRFFII